MPETTPHIVIAEHEFLIALDAEHIIASALACRTSLVRPEQLDGWDEAALAGVDLCLLDVPLDAGAVAARVRRLEAHGVPVLLTTVCTVHEDGVAQFGAIPVVMKPFEGERLVELVQASLGRQEAAAG